MTRTTTQLRDSFSRRVQLVVFLMLLSLPGVTALEFTVGASGPHHVVQGYYITFLANASITSGDDSSGTVRVTGVPSGAALRYPNQEIYCCGVQGDIASVYRISDSPITVRINTSVATPVGTYPLTITYTAQGISRSAIYSIVVDPVPVPLPKQTPPADTPVPDLALYEQHMITYGRKWCDLPMSMWEGSVWYYDGQRVYYNIADYTRNQSWYACAQTVETLYKGFVVQTNGSFQGWRYFPHGLYEDYIRNGDQSSKDAVLMMANGNSYTLDRSNPIDSVDFTLSRETAYALNTLAVAEDLGLPHRARYDENIEAALGHMDQWFVSKTASYTQPFMVALTSEALINYYEKTHDPRVPPLIKMAADQLWEREWDPTTQSVWLEHGDGTREPAADLNLLVAPIYAWVYKETGDVTYRNRGDQVWSGGVRGAWLDGGKQFSQSYRWSRKYLEWRTTANTTGTPLATDINKDHVVDLLDIQLVAQAIQTQNPIGNVAPPSGVDIFDLMAVVRDNGKTY
jgi:hypothetical protein